MYGWKVMGDKEWRLACLRERLLHPEWYEGRENVAAVVDKLRRELTEEEHGKGRQSGGGAFLSPPKYKRAFCPLSAKDRGIAKPAPTQMQERAG